MERTISSLAKSQGVRADTLRYYERLGLLSPKTRSSAGYRLYDAHDEDRLRFIKEAQRMGLRLADIKELLDVRDGGQCPCGHTDALVERRLAQVDEELARLAHLRDQLVELKERNGACRDFGPNDWSSSVMTTRGGASS